jgi:hypothetical protein
VIHVVGLRTLRVTRLYVYLLRVRGRPSLFHNSGRLVVGRWLRVYGGAVAVTFSEPGAVILPSDRRAFWMGVVRAVQTCRSFASWYGGRAWCLWTGSLTNRGHLFFRRRSGLFLL